MSAQAAWASNFLEDAVQRTSLRDTSPSIDEALSSLRKIVEMQHNLPSAAESMFSHRKKLPPNGLKGLEMPPVDSVVAALRMVKGIVHTFTPPQHRFRTTKPLLTTTTTTTITTPGPEKPPFFCMIIFWFVSVQDFSDLCKEVFFATEEYSEATFIIVNTGLYFMFSELAAGCDDTKTRKVYKRYCDLSQSNVETCLAQLNLFQPAKVEIIEALLTAVSSGRSCGKYIAHSTMLTREKKKKKKKKKDGVCHQCVQALHGVGSCFPSGPPLSKHGASSVLARQGR